MSSAASKPNEIAFDFTWQPKQNDVWNLYDASGARIIGYGGSRGGAKSHTSDDIMVRRRLEYPKTGGLFVMRILDDLRDIHIEPLLARFPILDDWYHRQNKRITFPNGSYIRFISAENFADLKKRKGRGFADIVVDQSELFTQEEIEFLQTINRHVSVDANKEPEGRQIAPKMLLTFNPGGIGHAYHKRIFVEKSYEGNESADNYAFVQAYGWDNAYWCVDALRKDGLTIHDYFQWSDEKRFQYFITRSEYGAKLDKLPDSKRKAELLGDFDVFEGQFFSNFRRAHHVITYNTRPNLATLGGFDYGNISVLEIGQRDASGTMAAADELYMENIETPSERAEMMGEFLMERELFGLHIMCDTDMYIDQISNVGYEKKPITIFNETLLNVMGKDKAPVLIKVNKKPLDNAKQYRGSINSAILDYLRIVTDPKTGKKRSKLYIGKDCPWLIRSFAELIHPETMANGLDYDNKHPMRHQFDAFKYWFQALYTPAPVKILTAKEKLAAQQRVGELATAQYEQDYDPRSDW